ncbi:MAG TPA: hypothetical protein O0X95_04245, partial [Methanocorpusculum sp.]|nr:hypothetical protein [Methanocorpusculum sp.]
AVARALINDPKLILADEPTGNLDPANATMISDLLFSMVEKHKKTLILVTHDSKMSMQIMEVLSALHKEGKTVLMVTHNPETAEYADRTVIIRDGEIVHE